MNLHPRDRMDESCLVWRLNAAVKASKAADGSINHEWLALHICIEAGSCSEPRTPENRSPTTSMKRN